MLTNLAPSLVSTHPDFVAQPTISKLFTLQHAAASWGSRHYPGLGMLCLAPSVLEGILRLQAECT